jgi:hypothetical protein
MPLGDKKLIVQLASIGAKTSTVTNKTRFMFNLKKTDPIRRKRIFLINKGSIGKFIVASASSSTRVYNIEWTIWSCNRNLMLVEHGCRRRAFG